MAAANDAIVEQCTNNPDFAIICSFFEHFGDKTGLLFPSFFDLQHMIEDINEVPYPLVELHVKLMRKLKKTVSFDRWEKAAVKFAHSYSDKDGWDIERFGYKNCSIELKLRLLKNLLEAQFDGNTKFKNELNQVSCDELRLQPLGKDIHGRRYWHFLDDDCNLRIYREDIDEETWELVSSDKESLVKLLEQLAAKKESFSSEETTPELSVQSSPNNSEETKSEIEIKQEDPNIEESESKRFKPELADLQQTNNAVVSAKLSDGEPTLSEAIEDPVLYVKEEGNGVDCETGNPGREPGQEACPSEKLENEQETNKQNSDSGAEDHLKPHSEVCDPLEISTEVTPNCSTSKSHCQLDDENPVRDKPKEPPLLSEQPIISRKSSDASFDENRSSSKVIETPSEPDLQERTISGQETASVEEVKSSAINPVFDTTHQVSLNDESESSDSASGNVSVANESHGSTSDPKDSLKVEQLSAVDNVNNNISEIPTPFTTPQEEKSFETDNQTKTNNSIDLETNDKGCNLLVPRNQSESIPNEHTTILEIRSLPGEPQAKGETDSSRSMSSEVLEGLELKTQISSSKASPISPVQLTVSETIVEQVNKFSSPHQRQQSSEKLKFHGSTQQNSGNYNQHLDNIPVSREAKPTEPTHLLSNDSNELAFNTHEIENVPDAMEQEKHQINQINNEDVCKKVENPSKQPNEQDISLEQDNSKSDVAPVADQNMPSTSKIPCTTVDTKNDSNSNTPAEIPVEKHKNETTNAMQSSLSTSDLPLTDRIKPYKDHQASSIVESLKKKETEYLKHDKLNVTISDNIQSSSYSQISEKVENSTCSTDSEANSAALVAVTIDDLHQTPPQSSEKLHEDLSAIDKVERIQTQAPDGIANIDKKMSQSSENLNEDLDMMDTCERQEALASTPTDSVDEKTSQTCGKLKKDLNSIHGDEQNKTQAETILNNANEKLSQISKTSSYDFSAANVAENKEKLALTSTDSVNENPSQASEKTEVHFSAIDASKQSLIPTVDVRDNVNDTPSINQTKSEPCLLDKTISMVNVPDSKPPDTQPDVNSVEPVNEPSRHVNEKNLEHESTDSKAPESISTTDVVKGKSANVESEISVGETKTLQNSDSDVQEGVKNLEVDTKHISKNLTFDFDSSAPTTVELPSIFKSRESNLSAAKGRPRKRGRQSVPNDDGSVNSSPQPVLRQSSRIAKLREKEDEERRKQEAERLQRLKEEHERREKRRAARDERMKKQEEKLQRRQQKASKQDTAYEEEEDDEESESSEEDTSRKRGKRGKRKRGKKKKDRPWDSSESSESSSESEDDGLDELHAEEENEELVFKSDHEFSPESDLDEDVDTVKPVKHARTARPTAPGKKKGRPKKIKEEEEIEERSAEEESADEELDTNCQKCGQSDHPEWILLCDRCDLGWHASCVKPALMVIPEGEWLCPPCDHVVLLERLQERLEAYEFLLKEKEAELERKKQQEIEAKRAEEEAAQQAMEEEVQSDENDQSADDANSGVEEIGGDDIEEEETEEDSGDDESEGEESEESDNDSDECLNKRRQRRAAKQANYSFKEFDDMIKSAIQDEGEEGKGTGKGPRNNDEEEEEEEDDQRSPRTARPSGKGHKRISTSDDDSDVMPKVVRKKKARKLNDLSATEDEDDSDEDFQGSSEDLSESEEEDEEASASGDSFVVDDDSDEDDVVHVRGGRKGRPASPVTRRSTRNARKKYSKIDSDSDSSEEESEYEVSTKRKRTNDSWGESSEESSSDASWGRSKKRKSVGRAKPPPKPKPKPPARKVPANRGRGRVVGRGFRGDSDDEPFRAKTCTKKPKMVRPVVEDDEESDQGQRRTTRGRQISYKEMISSGESNDDTSQSKGATKLPAAMAASRRGRVVPASAVQSTISARATATDVSRDTRPDAIPSVEKESKSLLSGTVGASDFPVTVFGTGPVQNIPHDVLPPIVESKMSPLPSLPSLPTVLPQEDVLVKEEAVASTAPAPVLPADLQVSRLIQRQQRSTTVPLGASQVAVPALAADLQVNRLINSQGVSSAGSSPARQSPMPQQRLVRDALDGQRMTPPPIVQQLTPTTPLQASPATPSIEMSFAHGGVIKQTRNSHPLTTSLYPGTSKGSDVVGSPAQSTIIRPYPTPAASTASLTPNVPSSSNPGNPLSIQGLLSNPHTSGQSSTAPPGPIRPYANTSHMISHGPFLTHPPYNSPYSAVPPSRSGYMGTPVTPTPRPAYPPIYPPSHVPPPHGLPPIHSYPPHHPGAPLRPPAGYQHAGFPQSFAAAAVAAANAEEERRIYRVTQGARESSIDAFDPQPAGGPLLTKSGAEDLPPNGVPAESEFGGLVSYFSSQQEDFGEA